MVKLIILAGLGSFIGGAFRFAAGIPFQNKLLFVLPFGTLIVNIVGCFLIGILFTIGEKGIINPEWRTFFIAGILGGFTTFSSFSIETIQMFRDGYTIRALTYCCLSVFGGFAATLLGITLFKS